jgi:hypothetical protein
MSKTPSKLQSASRTPLPSAQKSAKKPTQNGVAPKSALKSALKPARPSSAAAATTEEDEDMDSPPVRQSEKKKKRSIAPTTTTSAEDDDADEITLFHPSTSIHAPAPTAAEPASNSASNGHSRRPAASAEDGAGDEEDSSLTSSEFLRELLEKQTPDLMRVLSDLQTKIKEIRKQTVRPMIKEVKEGKLPTQEGVSRPCTERWRAISRALKL